MKITRYFQSCILIEDGQTRILIDPSGNVSNTDFGKLDAVFYTHEHPDHFDPDLAEKFKENGATIYANESTTKQMKSPAEVVRNGQQFEIKQTQVQAIELPHCLMWDGSNGPQNTGYLINGLIFHPGDGKELENLNVANLLVPITGPDVSLKDAFMFVKQVGASSAIPIHYDYIGTHPEVFQNAANKGNFKLVILETGQSTEI